jgi:hypothetical protein
VDGHVHPASVVTGNDIRDARLRSEFFDAERYRERVQRAIADAPAGSGATLETKPRINGCRRRDRRCGTCAAATSASAWRSDM